jgi:lipopolysaccharide cholinephosphotransferase
MITWLVRGFGTIVALAAGLLALTPVVDGRRQRTLRRVLADVCRVFAAHGIDYWCDFGTLLGIYRDGDIIRGDKDADLSIEATETPRIMALAGALRAMGYDLTDRGGRARKLLRIYDRRTRYYVDIYPYERIGANLRSVLASPAEDIPLALVARRASVPFLGTTIVVPEDVPAVLRHRYGSMFTTPRRGDKGATRRYSRTRSVLEDLQDNALGLWSWLRGLST